MAKNTRNAAPCTVPLPAEYPNLLYLFKSRLTDTRRNDFGQTLIDWATITQAIVDNIVYASNRPKPPKASLQIADGTWESSFCSPAVVAALKAQGARIQRAVLAKARVAGIATTKSVTVGTRRYAWNQSDIPDAAPLQIDQATNTANNNALIFGADFPKPPRALRKATPNTDLTGDVSTFFDPDVTALPTGWTQVEAGLRTVADLIATFGG